MVVHATPTRDTPDRLETFVNLKGHCIVCSLDLMPPEFVRLLSKNYFRCRLMFLTNPIRIAIGNCESVFVGYHKIKDVRLFGSFNKQLLELRTAPAHSHHPSACTCFKGADESSALLNHEAGHVLFVLLDAFVGQKENNRCQHH